MEHRLCKTSDTEAVREFFLTNEEHFGRWEPTREPDHHSLEKWSSRIEECVRDQEEGVGAFFISVDEDTGKVVAMCNINNVIREAFQGCYMGFGVSKNYEGTGCMYELCLAAIEHAFTNMKLHRIMANHMPANKRSAKLLHRLGFEKEGYGKSYLKINSKWEDHMMTALINPEE